MDWIYCFDVILVCFVNLVDIDIFGVEFLVNKLFESIELIVSYIYLEKLEDYGMVDIDVSFYVLNYFDYCVILGVVW